MSIIAKLKAATRFEDNCSFVTLPLRDIIESTEEELPEVPSQRDHAKRYNDRKVTYLLDEFSDCANGVFRVVVVDGVHYLMDGNTRRYTYNQGLYCDDAVRSAVNEWADKNVMVLIYHYDSFDDVRDAYEMLDNKRSSKTKQDDAFAALKDRGFARDGIVSLNIDSMRNGLNYASNSSKIKSIARKRKMNDIREYGMLLDTVGDYDFITRMTEYVVSFPETARNNIAALYIAIDEQFKTSEEKERAYDLVRNSLNALSVSVKSTGGGSDDFTAEQYIQTMVNSPSPVNIYKHAANGARTLIWNAMVMAAVKHVILDGNRPNDTRSKWGEYSFSVSNIAKMEEIQKRLAKEYRECYTRTVTA